MMRSGDTMKVSLTPDRLKSMEVRNHICLATTEVEFVVRCTTGKRVSVEIGSQFKKLPHGAPSNPIRTLHPHQSFPTMFARAQAPSRMTRGDLGTRHPHIGYDKKVFQVLHLPLARRVSDPFRRQCHLEKSFPTARERKIQVFLLLHPQHINFANAICLFSKPTLSLEHRLAREMSRETESPSI